MKASHINVKCPRCGESLTVPKNQERMFCSNCGVNLLLNKKQPTIVDEINDRENGAQGTLSILLAIFFLGGMLLLSFGVRSLFNDNMLLASLLLCWGGTLTIFACVGSNGEVAKTLDTYTALFLAFSFCLSLTIIVIGIWYIIKNQLDRILILIVCVVGPCIAFIPYAISDAIRDTKIEQANIREGKIRYTIDPRLYRKTDYLSLQAKLEELGFKNIVVLNLKDIRRSSSRKVGKVDKVIISGSDAERTKWYYCDEEIIVTYHGSWNE